VARPVASRRRFWRRLRGCGGLWWRFRADGISTAALGRRPRGDRPRIGLGLVGAGDATGALGVSPAYYGYDDGADVEGGPDGEGRVAASPRLRATAVYPGLRLPRLRLTRLRLTENLRLWTGHLPVPGGQSGANCRPLRKRTLGSAT